MASFWSAAFQGDEERVNELLDSGQDIDAYPPPGASAYRPTALANAVWGNRPEMVQLLLERGANPNLYDGDNNYSPLHWASYRGDHAECAELLLEAGADITALSWSNRNGFTPLEMAQGKNQVVSRKPGVMLALEAAARRPRPAWTPPRTEPRSPARQPTPLDEPPSPVLRSQSEPVSPFGADPATGSSAWGADGAGSSTATATTTAAPSVSAAAAGASADWARTRALPLEGLLVAATLAGVAAIFLPAPLELLQTPAAANDTDEGHDALRPLTRVMPPVLMWPVLVCAAGLLLWGVQQLVRLARLRGDPSRWWKARMPAPFLCPITGEVMTDPVSTVDGHTYERTAIERWLRTHDTSPMTGAELMRKDLTPAISLRQLIEEFHST